MVEMMEDNVVGPLKTSGTNGSDDMGPIIFNMCKFIPICIYIYICTIIKKSAIR